MSLLTSAATALVALAQATAPAADLARVHMTPAGWAFMISSTAIVTLVTFWCFYKVMTRPELVDHMQAPPDLEPRDVP